MIKEGEELPDITLESSEGKALRLYDELKGHKYLVIFFFPRANTPGCSREAAKFQEMLEGFEKYHVKVIGVSVDSPRAQENFKRKLGLTYTILSDRDKRASSLLGVLREGGSTSERVTFVVDSERKVRLIIKGVSPEEHPQLALRFIKSIESR